MFHLNHDSSFIDLYDSSNDNKTFPNSSYLSTSSPLNHLSLHESLKSIPFLVSTSTSYVLNVVDCLWAMFRAPHTTSKLCFSKLLNKLLIQKVPFVPIKFNGDVLFELPIVENLKCHFGQMRGMDKKYDNHAWCNVKTTNIKNDFIFVFCKVQCFGCLVCCNMTNANISFLIVVPTK